MYITLLEKKKTFTCKWDFEVKSKKGDGGGGICVPPGGSIEYGDAWGVTINKINVLIKLLNNERLYNTRVYSI